MAKLRSKEYCYKNSSWCCNMFIINYSNKKFSYAIHWEVVTPKYHSSLLSCKSSKGRHGKYLRCYVWAITWLSPIKKLRVWRKIGLCQIKFSKRERWNIITVLCFSFHHHFCKLIITFEKNSAVCVLKLLVENIHSIPETLLTLM